MSEQFQPGDRVFHAALGVYGTWLENLPDSVPANSYCRIELENHNGRTLLTPNTELALAGREAEA